MSLHLVSSDHLATFPSERERRMEHERIVSEMAAHLVAGYSGGLDFGDDVDVIEYLRHTPEQYRCRAIINHLDDAVVAARQMIVTAEMERT
jgi:hypothetical protein